jgi:hypothetical protein
LQSCWSNDPIRGDLLVVAATSNRKLKRIFFDISEDPASIGKLDNELAGSVAPDRLNNLSCEMRGLLLLQVSLRFAFRPSQVPAA